MFHWANLLELMYPTAPVKKDGLPTVKHIYTGLVTTVNHYAVYQSGLSSFDSRLEMVHTYYGNG